MLRPQVYDLFGEIPVTTEEIFHWVAAVSPRWLTPERSYRLYIERYDIPGKIRQAKAAGTFEATLSQRQLPWHERLAIDVVIWS